MPRVQILPLPEGAGDERPPFALVIDQAPHDGALSKSFYDDLNLTGDLAMRIGARAVLCFEDTIEIPANEVPLDDTGRPLFLRVEGDFTKFREQAEDWIAAAQRRLAATRV